MPAKIVKCVMVLGSDSVLTYSPEDGRDAFSLSFIYPDESGELWYWTAPKPEVEEVV